MTFGVSISGRQLADRLQGDQLVLHDACRNDHHIRLSLGHHDHGALVGPHILEDLIRVTAELFDRNDILECS